MSSISWAMDQRILLGRSAAPEPMMAELSTWVVLTGLPSVAEPRITAADENWAAKAFTGRMR